IGSNNKLVICSITKCDCLLTGWKKPWIELSGCTPGLCIPSKKSFFIKFPSLPDINATNQDAIRILRKNRYITIASSSGLQNIISCSCGQDGIPGISLIRGSKYTYMCAALIDEQGIHNIWI